VREEYKSLPPSDSYGYRASPDLFSAFAKRINDLEGLLPDADNPERFSSFTTPAQPSSVGRWRDLSFVPLLTYRTLSLARYQDRRPKRCSMNARNKSRGMDFNLRIHALRPAFRRFNQFREGDRRCVRTFGTKSVQKRSTPLLNF
jgi:hypothetical protein